MMKILVTGATGKVGRTFIDRFLDAPAYATATVRAFCHTRVLDPRDRLEIVRGDMANQSDVGAAVKGVTHVLHLATCKETPDSVMDVTVKGLFWLLEACRESDTFRQFILIGGDAGMGHFVYPHPVPVTEEQNHSPYKGCYALSKVLEEVLLEQYYVQYQLNGCCLRAPWIMEKDDFKCTLSFGDDLFGGPEWAGFVGPEKAKAYQDAETIPVMLDEHGNPIQRNFVHVNDLVEAILCALDHPRAHQQLFNISMDEPVNYRHLAEYLHKTRGLPRVEICTPFHSTWLDNTKAKFLLGWRPQYDLIRLVEEAWTFERTADDPRKVWYPG
jgi:UDP-glucose 4-epimerase